ncbi:MAG: siderophore-interacting protein, partial [Saccharopolyspora sp.]
MLAMVGELPPQARVQVFAEVADAAEEQQVRTEADVSWTWLHREGVAAGRSTLLEDAVRAADLGPRPDVWAGAESTAVQRIREHCQDVLGLDRRRVYALAYWRLDAAGP